MDIALCKELVNHAQKSGADDASVLTRHIVELSESACRVDDSIRIAVQSKNGSASAILKANASDRDVCLQTVKNLCQAAKIANAWGQISPSDVQNDIRTFNRFPAATAETCSPQMCSDECFHADCIKLNPKTIPTFAKPNLTDISGNLSLPLSQITRAVDETLFHDEKALSHAFVETQIIPKLTFRHLDEDVSLMLPIRRFHPFDNDTPLVNPAPLQDFIRYIADGFMQSACSLVDYVNPMPNLMISGWGMAILGHEAAHLQIDMTSSGKLRINADTCDAQTTSGTCPIHGLMPSSEDANDIQACIKQMPDHTLMVDAPDLWVRRNQSTLDVRFRIACEIVNASILRYLKPVTLRFDLPKIWESIQMTANPTVKLSLKCHDEMADFSAPACVIPHPIPIGRI